jgi:hypothetical protein
MSYHCCLTTCATICFISTLCEHRDRKKLKLYKCRPNYIIFWELVRCTSGFHLLNICSVIIMLVRPFVCPFPTLSPVKDKGSIFPLPSSLLAPRFCRHNDIVIKRRLICCGSCHLLSLKVSASSRNCPPPASRRSRPPNFVRLGGQLRGSFLEKRPKELGLMRIWRHSPLSIWWGVKVWGSLHHTICNGWR